MRQYVLYFFTGVLALTVIMYSSLDLYFHMRNHYNKILKAKSVVDTALTHSPHTHHGLKHSVEKKASPPADIDSLKHMHYPYHSLGIHKHNCITPRPVTRRNPNDMPDGHSPVREHLNEEKSVEQEFTSYQVQSPHTVVQIITAKPCVIGSPDPAEKCILMENLVGSNVADDRGDSLQYKLIPEEEEEEETSCEECDACIRSVSPPDTQMDYLVHSPTTFNKHVKTRAAEHEYLQFSLRITEDIIKNDLYSNAEIKRVFNSHIEANRGRLELNKMKKQIKQLALELNLSYDDILYNGEATDDVDLDEERKELYSPGDYETDDRCCSINIFAGCECGFPNNLSYTSEEEKQMVPQPTPHPIPQPAPHLITPHIPHSTPYSVPQPVLELPVQLVKHKEKGAKGKRPQSLGVDVPPEKPAGSRKASSKRTKEHRSRKDTHKSKSKPSNSDAGSLTGKITRAGKRQRSDRSRKSTQKVDRSPSEDNLKNTKDPAEPEPPYEFPKTKEIHAFIENFAQVVNQTKRSSKDSRLSQRSSQQSKCSSQSSRKPSIAQECQSANSNDYESLHFTKPPRYKTDQIFSQMVGANSSSSNQTSKTKTYISGQNVLKTNANKPLQNDQMTNAYVSQHMYEMIAADSSTSGPHNSEDFFGLNNTQDYIPEACTVIGDQHKTPKKTVSPNESQQSKISEGSQEIPKKSSKGSDGSQEARRTSFKITRTNEEIAKRFSKLFDGSQETARRSSKVWEGSPETARRLSKILEASPVSTRKSSKVSEGSQESTRRTPKILEASPLSTRRSSKVSQDSQETGSRSSKVSDGSQDTQRRSSNDSNRKDSRSKHRRSSAFVKMPVKVPAKTIIQPSKNDELKDKNEGKENKNNVTTEQMVQSQPSQMEVDPYNDTAASLVLSKLKEETFHSPTKGQSFREDDGLLDDQYRRRVKIHDVNNDLTNNGGVKTHHKRKIKSSLTSDEEEAAAKPQKEDDDTKEQGRISEVIKVIKYDTDDSDNSNTDVDTVIPTQARKCTPRRKLASVGIAIEKSKTCICKSRRRRKTHAFEEPGEGYIMLPGPIYVPKQIVGFPPPPITPYFPSNLRTIDVAPAAENNRTLEEPDIKRKSSVKQTLDKGSYIEAKEKTCTCPSSSAIEVALKNYLEPKIEQKDDLLLGDDYDTDIPASVSQFFPTISTQTTSSDFIMIEKILDTSRLPSVYSSSVKAPSKVLSIVEGPEIYVPAHSMSRKRRIPSSVTIGSDSSNKVEDEEDECSELVKQVDNFHREKHNVRLEEENNGIKVDISPPPSLREEEEEEDEEEEKIIVPENNEPVRNIEDTTVVGASSEEETGHDIGDDQTLMNELDDADSSEKNIIITNPPQSNKEKAIGSAVMIGEDDDEDFMKKLDHKPNMSMTTSMEQQIKKVVHDSELFRRPEERRISFSGTTTGIALMPTIPSTNALNNYDTASIDTNASKIKT